MGKNVQRCRQKGFFARGAARRIRASPLAAIALSLVGGTAAVGSPDPAVASASGATPGSTPEATPEVIETSGE